MSRKVGPSCLASCGRSYSVCLFRRSECGRLGCLRSLRCQSNIMGIQHLEDVSALTRAPRQPEWPRATTASVPGIHASPPIGATRIVLVQLSVWLLETNIYQQLEDLRSNPSLSIWQHGVTLERFKEQYRPSLCQGGAPRSMLLWRYRPNSIALRMARQGAT